MIRPSPIRRPAIELLAASFVVLVQELAFIRWLPVEVRVSAYFPNLVLISAFLGLGVGALRASRRSLLWAWPVCLVGVVLVASAMSRVAFTANDVTEHLWLLYYDLPEGAAVVEGVHLPLIVLFVASAAAFVPLGQYVGRRLETFREAGKALWGYALDLGGSLLGVLAFAAVSFAGFSPVIWFLPVALVGLVVVREDRRSLVLHLAAGAIVLTVVQATTQAQRFSPYYALRAAPNQDRSAVAIEANGSLHQMALELAYADGTARGPVQEGYHYPYRRLGRPVRKALVLGAGTGNDVAVLLDEGAEEVHAVEIDPQILALGRELHPNRPYADPRVTLHNVDARSFLNDTEETFDLIVFGTLDSMTRLSALSTVRLDNFVYTREGIAAARDRLTPDGGLVMYFMVSQEHIAGHLLAMLSNTFGRLAEVHRGGYDLFNTVFMAGPAFARSSADRETDAWYLDDEVVDRLAPSDDWPFLYLPERGVTGFYLSMAALLIGLTLIAVAGSSPDMRRALLTGRGIDFEMLCYGFAFLLIETKFVTAMNLAWGATWLTSAVVFGSILAVILVGTLLTEWREVPWQVAGAGLLVALIVVYVVPLDVLLDSSYGARLTLSVLYVGAPVLFASLCFASRFKVREAADLAFGWNLLGAVLGGLAEFGSMWLGFRALTLVALGAYLTAFLLANRYGRASTGAVVPSASG